MPRLSRSAAVLCCGDTFSSQNLWFCSFSGSFTCTT